MRQELPFRAGGHVTRVRDGEAVMVTEYPEDGLGPWISGMSLDPECAMCGSRVRLDVRDGAIVAREPCPLPDGITSVVTLAVPSGRMIVTDDLRGVYGRWDEEGMASYNSVLGQHQAIEAMAREGCAYGPVGNTCPGMYRTGEDAYVIASVGWDEERDGAQVPPGWTLVAGIITDLWAYSIADYADWQARGGDVTWFARPEPGWDWDLVDVTPGTYEFTHHTGEPSFDRDAAGTVTFAHVRRLP